MKASLIREVLLEMPPIPEEDKEESKEENKEENKPAVVVERFKHMYEKVYTSKFSDADLGILKRIFKQMHLEVKSRGHIFLINRLTNTLYFMFTNSQ